MALCYISAKMTSDATVNRDHINTRTTYMMLREERVWNVGVVQGVRFSNFVIWRREDERF
jgi:hypothetical protein